MEAEQLRLDYSKAIEDAPQQLELVFPTPKTIVAFSGGKDSTAMAYQLAEAGESCELFFTAAGNEPPEVFDHIDQVAADIGWPLVRPDAPTLFELIEHFKALPNWRQRWCTRMIKIVPCIAYLQRHPGSTLCVGLRADEPEREGLYGEHATYRYPLREAGMGLDEVWAFLVARKIAIPKRTDCMLCFYQRLPEWYQLWRDRPDEFKRGELIELRIGHTFRSPSRDTWPASLAGLRKEFESGREPRGLTKMDEDDPRYQRCRVCQG